MSSFIKIVLFHLFFTINCYVCMLVMWNLTDVWMNKRRISIWTTERNKQAFISCTRSTRVHLRMLQTANCLRSIKSQSGLAARQTCKSECFQCDRTHTTIPQSVFRRLYATIVTMYRVCMHVNIYTAYKWCGYICGYMCSVHMIPSLFDTQSQRSFA